MCKIENKEMTHLDYISQHLTWIIRQISAYDLRFAAVNIIGKNQVEIRADRSYFFQIKNANSAEAVQEILEELVPIIADVLEMKRSGTHENK